MKTSPTHNTVGAMFNKRITVFASTLKTNL
jgi:hypothetical protein